ncbi:NUDIX hydrolase [Rubellicoccus peritrichatus]|uniref:GDP-mannose pyrophosphatase n=1 Tax=Rubellicoccus peritrichatus TaxID=3080537 RepID=A0AAQ3LBH6_9BACT|nr:NUDIX hydrolase [Puniceicoccus sp. CR14]WOO40825.1 NUDIX hydrolase [Puniceicoccus sp. CR14]
MSNPSDEPKPAAWEILSERQVADCKVYRVFEQQARHPIDGREGTFYIMRAPDWVQAIPLTRSGEIILVNQYRFGSRQLSWEVPGGVMDPHDKSPADAAARELVEETGYVGDTGKVLGFSYPNPALQENRTHFVLIENCELVTSQSLDQNEELTVKLVQPEEAIAMARRGEISHTIAVNALFLLEGYLKEQV